MTALVRHMLGMVFLLVLSTASFAADRAIIILDASGSMWAQIDGKARSVRLSYWQANGLGEGGKIVDVKGSDDLVPAMLALVEKMAEHFAKPATSYPALPWPAYVPHFNDYAHLERIAEWSTAGGGEE